MILLALLVLNVDIAPRRPPSCSSDGDCMLSTFEGCCGSGCPVSPYAVTREEDAAQRRRCTIVDCAARSQPVKCEPAEPASAFRAACQRGQCVAVRTAPPPMCRADADCRVDWSFDANGCARNPTAVPVTAPPPPSPPPRPLTKKEGKPPQFGLTPGGSTQEPAACPAPAPTRAACSSGRCVLVRRFEE